MVASAEGGVARRSCNRAVALVTTVDAALFDSALITAGLALGCLPCCSRPRIIRYGDMSSLIMDRLNPDTHCETRKRLHAMQMVPVLRDEFCIMDDSTLRCICAFLGVQSRELVHIGSVCRRLRNLVIALTPSSATIVPEMIPLASLSSHDVVDSICSFFAPYKRGQFVQRLRLVDTKYASSLPVGTALPLCSHHVYPSLVKSMPSLTFLDLRGVHWDCHSHPHLPQYFFSDLHLVAPGLQTLKVGVDLFCQWSPGWWQRLTALEQIVVGSRRDQAVVPGRELRPPLVLHDEFFDMLRAPRRPWRVKLWCPLQENMLVRLLLPMQAFPEVQELTVNLSNTDILEELKRVMVRSPRDGKSRRATRGIMTHVADETDARTMFPSLQSLTLVNVEQCPLLPVELVERFFFHAPRFKYFTLVNTSRVPPPSPPQKLRQRTQFTTAALAG
ncbi:hypothetical protein TraAM80_08420 [Trypanosoma rangeli]|uniref:Uncharacterized protein n=1 Tax=Trypanosoma rangeli TaxID=5698 RepID=A0A422N0P3_TRYRA|nr:uncharacterized protein TraAM80_08420 [Trypanosoma rangeli]RNE99031.1 hypothetical protein TraAM80_08420 [Trypanosoma rangeli]|eukprot:RNE99031.1 hypothetical protein TraAM80_08420 [Trypanosoma rangeli]